MSIESVIKTRHRFIAIRKLLEEEINRGRNDVRETTPLTKAYELVHQAIGDFYEQDPSPFMYAGMNFIVDINVKPGVLDVVMHEPLAPTTMAAVAKAVRDNLQKMEIPLADRMAYCTHCAKPHKITDSAGKPIELPADCKWREDYKNATGGAQ